MQITGDRGFSLLELIVALGLTLTVIAVIFELVEQSRRRFAAEPDIVDRHQRVRVAVETLSRDLLMARAVLAMKAEGVAVLVVLHDLTFAAAYCDRLVLLHQGRMVASGVPSEVVTPEHVQAVYGPHVRVLPHPETGAPLVVPAVAG